MVLGEFVPLGESMGQYVKVTVVDSRKRNVVVREGYVKASAMKRNGDASGALVDLYQDCSGSERIATLPRSRLRTT